jgi:glutaredoxin
MRRLLIVCLVLASAAVSAQTYRYVDPQGRTVISDTPPPGRARDVSKAGAAPAQDGNLPYSVQMAAEKFPVTLYTSADCVKECKDGRDLLNSRGVPFAEKMLQKPDDVEELKKLVGDAVVPALKVGKQSFRGFETGAWNNLLDLAGYPKTAPYGSKPSGGLAR